MEQQKAEAVAWYREAIFYQLDLVDFAVLFTIGVLWSGALWMCTEAIKDRLAVPKPYPVGYRRKLAWGPVLFSGLACVGLFPWVLEGVGQPSSASIGFAASSFFVGVVGGLGSKVAHDTAGGLLRAAYDRISLFLRGGATDGRASDN